jgi:Mannosyl-glycoprotein endo-beta-N-acetylglucosaminidase
MSPPVTYNWVQVSRVGAMRCLYNPSYRGAVLKTLMRIACVGLIVSFGWTACAANDALPTVNAAQTEAISTIPTTGATATQPADRVTPPTPPPPPPGTPTDHFNTLPPGSALPSGAECATRVRTAAENRPQNTAANNNRGSRANANTNTAAWSGFGRVDGDYAGTTDQILQWAACKWGIDEDIVKAQMIKESGWIQSAVGDGGESFGIGQVRITAHASAFQYSTVNARNSTAYNVDYTYSSWRACYEGVYTWLNTVEHNGTYAAGDVWGCVGLWFSGRWYVNTDAYLNQTGDSVHWHFDNKTWLKPGF